MKTRLLCVILLIALCLAGCQSTVENVTQNPDTQHTENKLPNTDELKWGASLEEVKIALGVQPDDTKSAAAESGKKDVLIYNEVLFYDRKAELQVSVCEESGLSDLSWYVTADDAEAVFKELQSKLTQKYGAPYKMIGALVYWKCESDGEDVTLNLLENQVLCSIAALPQGPGSNTDDNPANTDPPVYESVSDIPLRVFQETNFGVYKNGEQFTGSLSPKDDEFKLFTDYSGRDCIIFADSHNNIYIRESTGALERGHNSDSVAAKVNDVQKQSLLFYDSPYHIRMWDPLIRISLTSDNRISIDGLHVTYIIDEPIKVKGFVRTVTNEYGKEKELEIILDPEYLHGIPLLTSNKNVRNFCINGTDITADTILLTGDGVQYGIYDLVGEKYVYAELSLTRLSVSYDTDNGYSNHTTVRSLRVISEDTDKIIDDPFSAKLEKDPVMTDVYNAVMGAKDKLLTDNTYGIVPIDLDFDGIPEILHSRVDTSAGKTAGDWHCDIDIYRVKKGKLQYIDTINNAFMSLGRLDSVLGLVTLEDGSTGWFGTSYKNRKTGEMNQTDYFYTLVGDQLKYRELFGYSEIKGSSESDDLIVKYRYMGTPIQCEVIKTEPIRDGEEPSFLYTWNGFESRFGTWEIYGFAREQFCKDITTTYSMNSKWISSIRSDMTDGDALIRYALNDREFSYKVAYIIDEIFLGTYNSTEMKYEYDFLGDYAKPVIYLYPEEKTDVSVSVDFLYGGKLTCTYPEYNDGWKVTAMPDGTLYDANGDEYYCLYWEAEGSAVLDGNTGFCVKGSDTAAFLREKLIYIGLTAREANEFIIYWLPLLQDNEYNIITLHTEDYARSVPLNISPVPDTVIRVFMTYTPSDEYVEVAPQTLPHYERNGFTVVEWGGSRS